MELWLAETGWRLLDPRKWRLRLRQLGLVTGVGLLLWFASVLQAPAARRRRHEHRSRHARHTAAALERWRAGMPPGRQ